MPRPPRSTSPDAASAPRIIGGDLRGRRLEFAPHERTRPMKDRVRETLFDLLGPAVRGTLAIDLFAGSGALGFEAVSRGAARAVLVERHFPTAAALERTARALGVADRVDVRPGDAFAWARRASDLPAAAPWLVFVSPPWALFRDRGPDMAALVEAFVRAAPAGSTFVVEADASLDPRTLPDPDSWRSRAIPPAVLYLRGGLLS
ncbi:MAG: RsmD family RNA methyltransferase [Planctomycetaceae bacterium]